MLFAACIDGNHTVQRWTAISVEVAALPLHETPLRKLARTQVNLLHTAYRAQRWCRIAWCDATVQM